MRIPPQRQGGSNSSWAGCTRPLPRGRERRRLAVHLEGRGRGQTIVSDGRHVADRSNDASPCRQSPSFAVPSITSPRHQTSLDPRPKARLTRPSQTGLLRHTSTGTSVRWERIGARTGLATLRPLPHIPGPADNRAAHMAPRNYGRRKSRGRAWFCAMRQGTKGTLWHSVIS